MDFLKKNWRIFFYSVIFLKCVFLGLGFKIPGAFFYNFFTQKNSLKELKKERNVNYSRVYTLGLHNYFPWDKNDDFQSIIFIPREIIMQSQCVYPTVIASIKKSIWEYPLKYKKTTENLELILMTILKCLFSNFKLQGRK